MLKEPTPEMVSAVFAMMGRRGASARAAALTAEERQQIARKAAQARWKKPKRKPKGRSR
jgi:hypothetical protein